MSEARKHDCLGRGLVPFGERASTMCARCKAAPISARPGSFSRSRRRNFSASFGETCASPLMARLTHLRVELELVASIPPRRSAFGRFA